MARIGLVLGAGGSAGHAYTAGVLAALFDGAGFEANDAAVVVGTSAGAWSGSLIRSGLSSSDLFASVSGRELSASGAELLGRMGPAVRWRGGASGRIPFRVPSPPSMEFLLRVLRSPWSARAGLLASVLAEGHEPTDPHAARLRAACGTNWPTRPLWIATGRLPLGERVVFGQSGAPRTDPATATAASCAVPGWFIPVEIEGDRYVDGAIHSPTNADLLVGQRIDLAVVVAPMSTASRGVRSFRGPEPLRGLSRVLLLGEARRLRRSGIPVLEFHPGADEQFPMLPSGGDGRSSRRIARLAREAALRRLDSAGDEALSALAGRREPRPRRVAGAG